MDDKPYMITVAVSKDELDTLQDLLNRYVADLNYRELDSPWPSPYNLKQWRTVRTANENALALVKRLRNALERKQSRLAAQRAELEKIPDSQE